MRTAIYGSGSIGTVLGAYLTKADVDIDLISRNISHIDALKMHGAKIEGTVDFVVPVNALTPKEMSGKYDIIFLITKQLGNESVVHFLQQFLADDGAICTMQNGLPELSVAEVIGAARTYGCTIAWGAEMMTAGVCRLTSEPNVLSFGLGCFSSNNNGKLLQIAALLGKMGEVVIEQNFIGARWSKLLVNSAFSGLSTVLDCTFGEVAANKESRIIAQKIIKECIDVARAANIKIEPIQGKNIVKLFDYHNIIKQKISFLLIPFAIKKHKNLRASMLQDIEKGKPCEIDAINGVICKYGAKYSFPTPYNDKVVRIIKEIEAKRRKLSWDNLQAFF
ncbi:MAG: 2-dehydropantoate 2-reductase [Prevotellaceae bacterium]|jgi:2-dehydropantoate 2-reductase|nr:2-dehydropantoate 2-reductase [Prevotellaceae bacterium]